MEELNQNNQISKKEKQEIRLSNYRKKFKKEIFQVRPQKHDILVISQCTKTKSSLPQKAMDMYLGSHHKCIKKASDNFDTYIISAGYGLISSEECIEPYNVSFNEIHKSDLTQLKDILHIRENLDYLIEHTNYKLIIFALGKVYLNTLDLSKEFKTNIPFVIVGANIEPGQKNDVKVKNITRVNIYVKHLKNLHAGLISSKGKLIQDIFSKYTEEQVINNPNLFNTYIDSLCQ